MTPIPTVTPIPPEISFEPHPDFLALDPIERAAVLQALLEWVMRQLAPPRLD